MKLISSSKFAERFIVLSRGTSIGFAILIIIGQPVWAGSPTPAIRTYLNKNNLSGKKVALFFLDIGLGKAIEKTRALMPNSSFVGELTLSKPLGNKKSLSKKSLIGVTH